MKSEEQLKLPGRSMAWWETARNWRTPPPKCPWNTRTNVHSYPQTSTSGLYLLVPPSSLSPPSSEREWAGNKRGGRSKKKGGAQIALLLTSFLCNPDHVSTTFKDREVKHFSLIALKLQNTYKWLLFSKVCLKMRFLHLTLHRTTKSHAFMLWCLIPNTC